VLCRERKEGNVFFSFVSKATSIGFVHNKAVGTRMKGKKSITKYLQIFTNITFLAQKNFQSVSTDIKGNPTKTTSKLQT
jgi:hypothetical protein